MTFSDSDRISSPDHDRARVPKIQKLFLDLVGTLEKDLPGIRTIGIAAGGSDGLLQGQPRGNRVLARPVDLTQNVEWPERDNLDTHPWIVDVPISQFSSEIVLQLLNRPVACRQITDEGKREIAAAGDHVVARQGVLSEHDDVQLVAG